MRKRKRSSPASQSESSIAPTPTWNVISSSLPTTVRTRTNHEGGIHPTPTSAHQVATRGVQQFTRPQEFTGRFTIKDVPWKSEYADTKSNEYTTLKSSLEAELNIALEKAIQGFVTCVVQWFSQGSVITHFAVYVNRDSYLTSEKLQMILLGAWSSGSLASFSLEEITIESQQSENEEASTETATFLKWELWKVISVGSAVIIFILLLCILGLVVRNLMLKKALHRERRTSENRTHHRQQQGHMPSRAAFSIIAASSAAELATILQNERRGQVLEDFKRAEGKERRGDRFQSHTYSVGTSKAAERLLANIIRGSEQAALQHQSGNDTFTSSETVTSGKASGSSGNVEFASDSYKFKQLELHEKQQMDQNVQEASHAKPKVKTTQATDIKGSIRSKVQAFEQGSLTGDEVELENHGIQDIKREPKKLKNINFHSVTTQHDGTERRKREAEIRPLGGVVKKFNVGPLRTPSQDNDGIN